MLRRLRLESVKQTVAALALAVFGAALLTGPASAHELSASGRANVVSSVERAWADIPSAGQVMTFSQGDFKLPQGGHLQGIQILYDVMRDRHVAFLSHDSATAAYLVIVEFPADLPGNGRVLAVHEFPSDGRLPPLRHSGGIQLVGDVLAVGLEDNQQKTRSEIQFWSVAEPAKPTQLAHLTIRRAGPPKAKTAGAVGLVERENDYLLAVANWDSRAIDFYKSNGLPLTQRQCRFQLAASWQVETAARDDWAQNREFGTYQAVNLIADDHGNIFLIGFDTTSSGQDVADLFAVHMEREPAALLAKRARKSIQLAGANHFRYSGGVWIDRGRLAVLASQRDLIEEVRLTIVK